MMEPSAAAGRDTKAAGGRQNKSDLAYGQIRASIMDGTFPPGMRLHLRALATQLEMSVMPIREALGMLETEGLVKGSDHRGTRVASISRDEILEVVGLRMWLEAFAVHESALNPSAVDVTRARHTLEAGADALAADASMDFTKSNREFHEILEAVANETASSMIAELWDRLWQVRRQMSLFTLIPGQMKIAQEEHEKILAAVEAGNAEGAVQAMERHRTTTLAAWATALASLPV
jgi:DNA-binding GntR family transcriptional regulator